ncbi:MAG: J domain-containing protein [Nitrospira defluvii]|nr:J domain-containing protein [Nitrospira defluvii]
MTKFPLSWPTGWKRTDRYRRADASFSKAGRPLSVYDGTTRLLGELRRFGVRESDVIISTNVKLRLDGLPLSNQSEPADCGAAVYWKKSGKNQVMATDRYTKVADNLAALASTLEAMRAIERHGGAVILERAFLGFTALPAPKPWHEVLGVQPFTTLHFAKVRYRELATECHPDKGGDPERMAEINRAWSDAQRELGA